MMQGDNRWVRLNVYFFWVYLSVLALSLRYLRDYTFFDLRTGLFSIAVILTYAFFYISPALVLSTLAHCLLRTLQKKGQETPNWANLFVYGTAVLAGSATLLLVFADGFIFNLYGFHLNGFVWNLLTTRGGVDSLGGGHSTMGTVIAIVLGLLLLQTGIMAVTGRLLQWWGNRTKPQLKVRYLLLILLLLSAGERLAYGISELQGHTPTLMVAGNFPLYKGTTLHSLASKLGYEVSNQNRLRLNIDATTELNYPLKPLQIEKPARPYNIVWLMAESLRADMLNPEIMPASWTFGQQAHRFTRHYSGGNGTRMSIFSSFYGLYGPYWFSFLGLQRSPVLIDVLQAQNYQFGLYTSQSFTYPELDKTVFAKVPRELFNEATDGLGWERDRENVGKLIDFIQQRDQARPFMSFMFFESPHARYHFPEDSVISKPYLEDFNYVTMSLERDIDLIKNRYINSCHHLDSQIKRVLDVLAQEHLLENTIVLLTGDHGEEFLEKGHWGHNSAFTEEQTLVPLVLWVPGRGAGTIERMTSHLDIPATLLPLLGVKNPPEDYSFGSDLFGLKTRSFTVTADWERVCYIDDAVKVSIPFGGRMNLLQQVTDRNDSALPADKSKLALSQKEVLTLMLELKKFNKN